MLDWLEVPLELPSCVELLYPSTTPRTAPSKLWIIAQQSILMVAVLPKLRRIRLGYRFLKRSCSERPPVVTKVVARAWFLNTSIKLKLCYKKGNEKAYIVQEAYPHQSLFEFQQSSRVCCPH
jgi:hypothetical protein